MTDGTADGFNDGSRLGFKVMTEGYLVRDGIGVGKILGEM